MSNRPLPLSITPQEFDPKQTKVVTELSHDSPLIGCRFDPTGKFVVASAQDNKVIRWDLSTQAKLEYVAHDSWVRGLEFTPDGSQLITGGFAGRLIWWNLESDNPEPVRTVDAHGGWIRSSARSPDGKYLATGGNDLQVKVWDLSTGELIQTLSGHEKHVYSVLFHPEQPILISGDLAGSVRQWDWPAGTMTRSFDAKALHSYNGGQRVDFGGVRSLSFTPDRSQLACGGLHNASNPLGAVHEPLIVLFDWESQEALKSLVAPDIKGVIWRCLYHPSGHLIGASGGSSGGYLLFWAGDSDKDLHRLKLPHLARDMDLHADGVQIATAHYDKKLRICSLAPTS